jgi:response regulator RpfG family c-di-GMP phosphodiesterase
MTPMTSVLIVDDEPAVRDLMSRWVSSLGLRPQTAANADEALASLRSRHYDLAVIDVMMPGRDGLWLAGELRRDHPQTAVIVATACAELPDADARTPIADCLVKPFPRERFALAVDRGRQWRKQVLEEVHWHAMLSMELDDRAAMVIDALHGRIAEGAGAADAMTALLVETLPEVAAHGDRVARYAASVARELDVDRALGEDLAVAARFHDVGKLAVPDALAAKPSPLTPGEAAIMRRHVEIGADILEAMPALAFAGPAVRSSHEWYGGGGYPRQAAGTQIPFVSRIIAVADAYDAMTQDRAYRIRCDASDAVGELLRCSPTQFDPEIVAAFLSVVGRH